MLRIRRLLPLASCLLLCACASWQPPPPMDENALRREATELKGEGVVVRARVLSPQESQRIAGVDLTERDIQPVWVEVVNGSGQDLTLLQSGTDPEYFSPLEVSWTLHSWGGGRRNAAIDEHLQAVAFRRGTIAAGRRRSGLIFTNPQSGHKLLNIDLLGEHRFIPFTVIVPVPDAQGRVAEPRGWHYAPGQIVDYQHEQVFSEGLLQWFAQEMPAAAAELTQPLSLVWVGRPQDLGSALVRRGYRLDTQELDREQQLSGRPPDFVMRKSGRGAPANWIRLWALPMSFQGRRVLVGQAGAPSGGRFAPPVLESKTDPALDEVRDMVIQDLLYSGGLIKLAIAHPQPMPGRESVGDGRVGVVFIAARPLRVRDVRIVDWAELDWSREPQPYTERDSDGE